MNLVIVESPTKARTIKKFLSSRYKVLASQGHLIDLPRSKLGVDIENDFTPSYITIRGRGNILKELRDKAKKADRVFLAADPDREGEAICWHLGKALKLDRDKPCRVEFNEITRTAVKEAFKKPRQIDYKRVDAQQTRRILDRLVGYSISPLLWRKVKSGLSAGRVQSVAVRLICDREEEISKFEPVEYWTLDACLEETNAHKAFKAGLEQYKSKKIELGDETETARVVEEVKNEKYIVDKITRSKRKKKPFAPFTTSSLQQEASSKLGFTGKKTMRIAQQLYEGINVGSGETVGLVTYIRTDSTRISPQAGDEVRVYIDEKFGRDYLPEKAPVYKSKKGAQEAHEAIRPTSVRREPNSIKNYLNRDQNRLYNLIWNRTVASQMNPAVYDQVRVDIVAGDYMFRSTGSTLRFPGFTLLYKEKNDEKDMVLPDMEEGCELALLELIPEQHFTKPPPRYNEASLVKTLEDKGIGRPSTYSPIIETIQSRGYVVKENKTFLPTEIGFIVVELMVEYFPEIIDVDFTARLEQRLDEIEEGNQHSLDILNEFYHGYFKDRLDVADTKIEKVEIAPEVSDEVCPHCKENLVYKDGRFGRFLACPAYPECKFTKNVLKETGVKCPLDGGMIVERRSKKGRTFYGCSNYPDCEFTLWNRPLDEKCPQCGALMTEARKGKNRVVRCSNKECSHEQDWAKRIAVRS